MKAFFGVNYVMAINQLPMLPLYKDSVLFIESSGIQNVFRRDWLKVILSNLNFADNPHTDKGYKIGPVIEHLNESFCEACSNKSTKYWWAYD